MTNAVSAAALLNTLGINTHLDFDAYGYQNLATVDSDIEYLGVKIVRDSAETAADAQTWLQVAQATGAKFDDYIAETSPAGMQTDLGYITQLAQEGILASVEGGNEEDDPYPASLGNTLPITAQFQQQVYALGQQLGLRVINMSFGAGWTAANDWEGDYGTVGSLAAYATDANAHTYPNAGQLPDDAIQQINALAAMADSGQPVITTEIGWSTSVFSETAIAKYVLDAAMDGIKNGDAGMYFYGLFDDGSGNWGMFNADGTPRPAATALHDLTTLLADPGTTAATFTPGSLNYSLSGTESGDNSVLIEKSNGSFWLSLWNEAESANSPHMVTVNLGEQAATVLEYDPLTGISSIETWSNVASVQVSVPDHPVLLEIVPATSDTMAPPIPPPIPPPVTRPPSPTDLSLTLPTPQTVTAGTTRAITGVSIQNPWAAAASGSMTVNVWDDNGDGTVSVPGHAASTSLTVSGTLAQINAALAALSFTAAGRAGSDGITVDAWNQAGVEKTQTVAVTVTVSAAAPTPPRPIITGPIITVPATERVTTGSTTTIAGGSVTDAFAASNPGTLALSLNAGSGRFGLSDPVGTTITGLGTNAVTVDGTLAQINADLANLSYSASATSGSDSISVNVWDQAGLDSTATIGVAVTAAPPTTNLVTIAADTAAPVIAASRATIETTAGNHSILINGSGDVISAIGGTETVMAFVGDNAITTGAGNDTIQIAGSGNVVDAGAGANQIDDGGTGSTIALPQAGHGSDVIHGEVLQNLDTLDLRSLLAATKWTGSMTTLGNFLHTSAPDGADTVISVTPSGNGGASYTVATLYDSGPVSLATLLVHSLV
jgi:hypothetical protein